MKEVREISFEEQRLRSMHARVIALCLEHLVLNALDSNLSPEQLEEFFDETFESVSSSIQG